MVPLSFEEVKFRGVGGGGQWTSKGGCAVGLWIFIWFIFAKLPVFLSPDWAINFQW